MAASLKDELSDRVMVCLKVRMGQFTKAIGRMISKMEKATSLALTATNIKACGRMINKRDKETL